MIITARAEERERTPHRDPDNSQWYNKACGIWGKGLRDSPLLGAAAAAAFHTPGGPAGERKEPPSIHAWLQRRAQEEDRETNKVAAAVKIEEEGEEKEGKVSSEDSPIGIVQAMAMDWANLPDVKGEKGEKKELKGTKPDKVILEAILDIGELSIQNARGIAQIEGFLYKTWKMKSDDKLIKDSAESGKKYAADVKGKPKHGKGPPHPYAAVTALKNLEASAANEDAVKAVQSWGATYACSVETTAKSIPVFFVAKMYEDGFHKIVWHDETPEKAFDIMMTDYLRSHNGEQMPGTAPRKPMERKIRAFLDKFGRKSKKKDDEEL